MPNFNFEAPSRQSNKGIVVLWGAGLLKCIRRFYLLFFVVVFQWVKQPEQFSAYLPKIGLGITVLLIYIFISVRLKYGFTI